MKRLTWILLAVFCTTFARVQPVESAQACHCACCHCQVPGGCSMPCSGVPMGAPVMGAAVERTSVALPSVSKALPIRTEAAPFYSSFVDSTTRPVAIVASAAADPVAVGPLFKAHCSFLI